MNARLVLEDGSSYLGEFLGKPGRTGGEIVFNTAMSGYQEILTDPSYSGQMVLMTYPQIGNYGVNEEDIESSRIFASGFIVKEASEIHSNFRARKTLHQYLFESGVTGIQNIDTRAITRKIRTKGAMKGVIGHTEDSLDDLSRYLHEIPNMEGQNLVQNVSCKENYAWDLGLEKRNVDASRPHVVVIDCGVKYNILRHLVDVGMRTTVVPYRVTSDELATLQADGILISNGPGDPDAVPDLPQTVKRWIGKVPILGICLGHQILALAIGAKTYKLKFGHHGANHPVQNIKTGKIEITSQNHGFAVDGESLEKVSGNTFGQAVISHRHLTDETIEGFELPDVAVQAIQYHPEASPGPHDAGYLFSEFAECIKSFSKK